MSPDKRHSVEEYLDEILFHFGGDDTELYTRTEFLKAAVDAIIFMPEFDCEVCGVDTLEADERYMVRNDLWRKYGVGKGLLCIGCLEWRLGRPLGRGDFTDVPLNTDVDWRRSERLRDRLAA